MAAWAACALSLGATAPVRAQHAVAGQVTILERSDAHTPDLADAVVWLEPVQGVGATATPASAAPAPQIAMRGRAFAPHVRVVAAGGPGGVPNDDPFRHNVFSRSGPSEFDLGLYERGASRGARVARAGVYPVFCDIHARMAAFIVAVPTPWVARPDPSGRFVIDDVPAGRYTLRAWHERGGQQARPLQVGGTAPADASVQLDARGYRPVPHRNKFGLEYGPPSGERY